MRGDLIGQRDIMLRTHLRGRGVTAPRVLAAMRAVSRESFLPEHLRARAYEDRALPLLAGQTISQPYMVAAMTEAMQSDPDDRVLEVGTGSGYQTAVLSHLVSQIYSVERLPEMARWARACLEDAHSLGAAQLHLSEGDGSLGLPQAAPFDAILVTAAASHVPPPLVAQLKPGGRMVIPVGGGGFSFQHLLLVEKDGAGRVTTRALLPVRFVPLTGGH